MAQVNKKLAFLTVKIIEKLNISESGDESVTLIMQNLLLQNKEYQRIPKADLKDSIIKVVDGITQQKTVGGGKVVIGDNVSLPLQLPQSPVEPPATAISTSADATDSEASTVKARKRKRGTNSLATTKNDEEGVDDGGGVYRSQVTTCSLCKDDLTA